MYNLNFDKLTPSLSLPSSRLQPWLLLAAAQASSMPGCRRLAGAATADISGCMQCMHADAVGAGTDACMVFLRLKINIIQNLI